ncbi:hypothetical protein QN277_010222 [Acacia crassicarpa]|uniref:Putative plant transposon protein domain-containing protein n=1 Tax=Acacia crassicarpa TaxID=499986 RepID=A0AAE1IMH1_9FABA|nr:hypothetical protein QN277_010222 [Acacia crassicarpa]
MFYFNMNITNAFDDNGDLQEARMTTFVRGQKIVITAQYINTLLGIIDPPSVPVITYTDAQIFQILRPNTPIGALNFPLVSMPPLHRVLWYIYTRNLVQKGNNFTHFARKDHALFASIIDKVPHNIGEWVYSEMHKFKSASKPSTPIPFPNLVSLILFEAGIWHLESNEAPVKPLMFGQSHLNHMGITFKEGTGQSKARSNSRVSYSQAPEAQSSLIGAAVHSPPSRPPPSMVHSLIKGIVEKVVTETVRSLQDSLIAQQSEITAKIEAEVGKLINLGIADRLDDID